MKKKASFFLLLIIASSSLPAQTIANLATGKLSNYDAPLIDAIDYFILSFFSFHGIALTLATALGFIGIVWCAFKMAFGTENVRKAAVDVMCKFLLFTIVMALYPQITSGILDTATSIGMHAGGGYENLLAKFGAFRKNMESKVNIAQREMFRMLDSVSDPENSGGKNVRLTPELVEQIVGRFAITEEDKKDIIAEMSNDPRYNVMTAEEYQKYQNTQNALKFGTNSWRGVWNPAAWATRGVGLLGSAIYNKWFNPNKTYNDLAAVSKAVDKNKAAAIAKSGQEGDGGYGWDSPAVKHALVSLKAMQEVFSKNPAYDPDMAGSQDYNIPEYLFDPFMRDEEGRHTNLLSPGAMIKTGVVIADLVSNMANKKVDEVTGEIVDMEIATENKPGIKTVFFNKIQELIFSLLFTIGIVAACVFCAVQYMMTIFEFFILTSVGIIFVPCILWDGTKSFAAKLVTLFLAYFFKLMLMTFCLLWVYSFFLDFGITIITSYPILSLLNLGYLIFATLLGWVVTQNGPKLATALLNGTPDLSMGEFMRAAGTAAAGAYAAKRAASTAGNAVQKTGAIAHKGLQKGVNTFAGLDAMRKGVSAAVNTEGDKQGWSKGQRFGKTVGGVAGLVGQNIKNSASTFFTGVENKGDHTKNVSNMGKGKSGDNTGADGKQTYGDAKTAAHDYQKDKLTNENNSKPKASTQTPPDTTPKFDGKRDTSA